MAAYIGARAEEVATVASEFAPVLTGELAGNMEVEVTAGPTGAVLVRVNATDFKADWHEFGTEKMPAHPFLRPALERVLPGARIEGGR